MADPTPGWLQETDWELEKKYGSFTPFVYMVDQQHFLLIFQSAWTGTRTIYALPGTITQTGPSTGQAELDDPATSLIVVGEPAHEADIAGVGPLPDGGYYLIMQEVGGS